MFSHSFNCKLQVLQTRDVTAFGYFAKQSGNQSANCANSYFVQLHAEHCRPVAGREITREPVLKRAYRPDGFDLLGRFDGAKQCFRDILQTD